MGGFKQDEGENIIVSNRLDGIINVIIHYLE